ncbi:MAG TPA: 4Fe-4S dicluster domain-containing protein [Methanocorpusculum sp.]|nr:4Fe-4S dicluster domain-containing protein [Methanocorpusculum sp.]
MKMLKTIIKQFLHKPATIPFPKVPGKVYDKTRGHIVFDGSKCTSCSNCMRHCPAQAISIDKAAKTWSIDRFRCIMCNNCIDHCKFGSLSFENTYSKSAAKNERGVDTYEITYVKPERPKKDAPAKDAKTAE